MPSFCRLPWLFSALLVMPMLFGCSGRASVDDLVKFAPVENYPEDTFLDSVSQKSALVIVAHDDDDCAMSGTIAMLKARGWSVRQLSLQRHVIAATGENPARLICQGNELLLNDGVYRQEQIR